MNRFTEIIRQMRCIIRHSRFGHNSLQLISKLLLFNYKTHLTSEWCSVVTLLGIHMNMSIEQKMCEKIECRGKKYGCYEKHNIMTTMNEKKSR